MKHFLVLLFLLAFSICIFADGTEPIGNPRVVSTLDHLLWISTNSSSWDEDFIQIADIDASATSGWNAGAGFSPIGEYDDIDFTGTYDGQGFEINSLYIDRSDGDDTGLFGAIKNSIISNLGITNANITGEGYVGGLVGYIYSNSEVNNCYSTGSVYGVLSIGGLIGGANNSTITNSYSTGSVDEGVYIGGLIGEVINSTITNSYSTGSVVGTNYVGGLVGYNSSSTVNNSYSTGSVSGTGNDIGGLVGYNYSSTVNYSFWNTVTSGQLSSAGGIGKSTAEMQMLSTYTSAGWDFMDETTNGTEDIWGLNPSENGGYPFLQWQGYEHIPLNGNGTQNDPYQISSLIDLHWLSETNSVWDAYFTQTADINASNTQSWNSGAGFSPIGNGTHFTGTYDGDGYEIDSLFINRPSTDYCGLFGYTDSAQLQNIGVTNANITGDDLIGGLVGLNDINSSVYNCYSTGSVVGTNAVGGLVGGNYSSTVNNCFSTGNVNSDTRVGGLVGRNDVNSEINNCYSTGSVTGDGYSIGGLVGGNYSNSSVNNSYSTGSVEGTGYNIGGLVGFINNSTVNNCYSTGSVEGTGYNIGGLVGINNNFTVNFSFWNTQTSGQPSSSGGIGKSTAEMQNLFTYLDAGWDFMDETTNGTEDIWGINVQENGGYPFLQWQGYEYKPIIGSGIPGDEYQIATLNDLLWVSRTGSSWDKYFIQTADIDASLTSDWNAGAGFSPIGNDTTQFTGNYDGQEYEIEGLFINQTDADGQGLFGITLGSHLEDIHLVDVNIEARAITGALVGWGENLDVFNCSATGNITAGTQTANNNSYTGGLIGRNSSFGATSTISNCYTDVDITDTEPLARRIGGITGFMLSGWTDKPGETMLIENCYALGSINGYQEIGGLVGVVQVHANGQLITISNCYSTTNLPDSTNNGGIIGKRIGDSITSGCFWDTQTTAVAVGVGSGSDVGVTGKNTAEMQDIATYTDTSTVGLDTAWDFVGFPNNDTGAEDYWGLNIFENGGYPFLAWQGFDHTYAVQPSGEGTVENPYEISSLNELLWLSLNSSVWGANFTQTADINASNTQSWNSGAGFSPIGTDFDNSFTGNYDGNGYEIDSLYINRPSIENCGLFGYTNYPAQLQNVGLTNANITGNNFVGVLVGVNSSSPITSCYSTGSVNGNSYVGGLVGSNYLDSIIENCYSTGSVNGDNIIGGLSGDNWSNSTIANSYSTSLVSGTSNVGGLVGLIDDSIVSNSFWDTVTSGQTISAGGTGKTTAEMQTLSTYINAGWDFMVETENGEEDYWGLNIAENGGYPFLQWQGYTHRPYIDNNIIVNSISPPVGDITLMESESQLFEIDAYDPDGRELEYSWLLDGEEVSIDSLYNYYASFNSAGNHILELSLSDTYYTTNIVREKKLKTKKAINRESSRNDSVFIWDITVNDYLIAGSGSDIDPYQISSLLDLRWLSETDSVWDAHFTQTANINASNTQNWNDGKGFSPIGYEYGHSFSGNYNGGGYKIDSLYINRPSTSSVGLFGVTYSAYIKNIGLTNANITGDWHVGGLVGYNYNNSAVYNCYSTGSVQGYGEVGGLVGCSNVTTITNSYSTGSVAGDHLPAGGLVGRSDETTITNCYSTGNVTGNVYGDGNSSGGLVGRSDETTITNCYSTGSVQGEVVGGLVGCNSNSSVDNCYSTGSVDGDDNVGGFVGYNYSSTVNNSYSTGSVDGSYDVGGFVGYNYSSTVNYSFWNTTTSGQPGSAGGTGKTTAEMQTLSTYLDAGWDFMEETINGTDDFWDIDGVNNSGYPWLSWQTYPPTTLNTPENVMIVVSETEVTISWDAVTGANSYKIFAADSPDGIFIEDTSGSFDGNSWTATIDSERKFYYVKASTDEYSASVIRFLGETHNNIKKGK